MNSYDKRMTDTERTDLLLSLIKLVEINRKAWRGDAEFLEHAREVNAYLKEQLSDGSHEHPENRFSANEVLSAIGEIFGVIVGYTGV